MFIFKKLSRTVFIIYLLSLMISAGISFAETSDDTGKTVNEIGDKARFVSIDFNDVDINEFIKLMSKLTGKNFVVDRRVKGNVTIISPTKISVEEAYRVFESVLDINGFATVESGSVIKIIPSPNAKSDNIDTKIINRSGIEKKDLKDRLVTRLIPLEYARSDELVKLFRPLLAKGDVVLSYPDTNMMIITATQTSISRLMKIIEAIDMQNVGKMISVIPVKNADAAKLVSNLSQIFSAGAKSKKRTADDDYNVKFVSDERTNSIILLASNVQTEKVKSLIEVLDQEIPKGEERIRVYYLEHASAEDLVKVLLEIPSGAEADKKTTGKKSAPLLSEKVKIMADKATNSLIIMADKEDYPVLEEVISKLDIPRAMVYIECLIMEVNVTRGLNIGTEWKAGQNFNSDSKAVIGGFGNTGDSGFTNLASVASGALPKGFSVGVLGENFTIGGISFPNIQAIVQAYRSDKDVNIIATPQILTTENEEATITIGKNVPYQTRSAADSGTETYNSFEYKDVGITLKITPQISKDRLVKLSVFQELTKLDSVNTSSADRPTTLKRKIETMIIVEDSNSVVIGGLIDESLTKTTHKTPCLGDMPGLGWAFKSTSEGEDKTNLYVFLTPRVVKNPGELEEIYSEKKERINLIKAGEVLLYDEKKNDKKNRP